MFKSLVYRLVFIFILTFSVSLSSSAEGFDEFECDFSGVLEGFPDSDLSCDQSIEDDGTFDVSCDYSYDDEATDTSSSGSFDASCDLEDGLVECDASVSYDFDSPNTSISRDSSCDSVGSDSFLSFSCGTKVDDPILKELIESFGVACGVPQNFSTIMSQLIEDRNLSSVKELTKDLSDDVKGLSSLSVKEKQRTTRSLKSALKLTRRRKVDKAQARILRAETILKDADLTQEEKDSLCATPLFCVFE